MILLVLRGVIFTCESLGFLFTGKSLGIFTTYVHVDHEGRQLRAICFEFSFFLWILFGGYLVMYVDTGLERPAGGVVLPSPHWETRSFVICHRINTSTDVRDKKEEKKVEIRHARWWPFQTGALKDAP